MLKPNIQVVVWLENESIKIKPTQTILDIAGTFVPRKAIKNSVLLREKMAKNYAKR